MQNSCYSSWYGTVKRRIEPAGLALRYQFPTRNNRQGLSTFPYCRAWHRKLTRTNCNHWEVHRCKDNMLTSQSILHSYILNTIGGQMNMKEFKCIPKISWVCITRVCNVSTSYGLDHSPLYRLHSGVWQLHWLSWSWMFDTLVRLSVRHVRQCLLKRSYEHYLHVFLCHNQSKAPISNRYVRRPSVFVYLSVYYGYNYEFYATSKSVCTRSLRWWSVLIVCKPFLCLVVRYMHPLSVYTTCRSSTLGLNFKSMYMNIY